MYFPGTHRLSMKHTETPTGDRLQAPRTQEQAFVRKLKSKNTLRQIQDDTHTVNANGGWTQVHTINTVTGRMS